MDGQSLTLAVGLLAGAGVMAACRRVISGATWERNGGVRWGNAVIEAALKWPFPAWRVTVAFYASIKIEPGKPRDPAA